MSLGIAKHFPKLKSNSVTSVTLPKQKQLTNNLITFFIEAVHKIQKQPRLVIHILLVIIITSVILLGSSTLPETKIAVGSNSNKGYGAYLDKAAVADVAATVAEKTDLLITDKVVQSASKITAQVSLQTSGDDYLAKNSTVTTAGKVNHGIENYQVVDGDTISSLATKFNITTNTIRWTNNLANNIEITPGQNLAILPISGLLYIVQPGDTPQLLASRYQSDAEQIISFNNAEVKGLQAGQKIIIPDGIKPEGSVLVRSTAVASLFGTYSSGNSYSYGYCTYYVASRRSIPGNWGNAWSWYYNAKLSGFAVGRMPKPGAVAWTSAGYYGHVAYVEQVTGDRVLVSEMNYAGTPGGGWNRITSRWVSYDTFLYIY